MIPTPGPGEVTVALRCPTVGFSRTRSETERVGCNPVLAVSMVLTSHGPERCFTEFVEHIILHGLR